MDMHFKRRLEELGNLVDTGKKAVNLKPARWVFVKKEYPIYSYTANGEAKMVHMIFSDDGMPFVFGMPHMLEKGEDDKHWHVVRDHFEPMFYFEAELPV